MEKKKFRLVKLKRYFTSKVLTGIIATGKHTRLSFSLEGIKRKPLKYMRGTEQAQKRDDRKFDVLFCLKRCNAAIIQVLSRKHLLFHSTLCLA